MLLASNMHVAFATSLGVILNKGSKLKKSHKNIPSTKIIQKLPVEPLYGEVTNAILLLRVL